jgi:hypothetical protein
LNPRILTQNLGSKISTSNLRKPQKMNTNATSEFRPPPGRKEVGFLKKLHFKKILLKILVLEILGFLRCLIILWLLKILRGQKFMVS